MSKRNTTVESEVQADIESWEREGYVEYVSYHRSLPQVANRNGRVGRKPVDY